MELPVPVVLVELVQKLGNSGLEETKVPRPSPPDVPASRALDSRCETERDVSTPDSRRTI